MRQKAVNPRKTVRVTFLVATAVYLFWLAGIVLAPYLRSRSSPWSGLAYALYTPVCHQVAGRSFYCFGQPLAVCARCTGIYLGFFIGLCLYPSIRGWSRPDLPSGRVFLLFSAPIVLDTAANFLRLWQTPNAIRLTTGVLWGAILPFYFIPGIADLFISQGKNRLNLAPGSS